MKTRSTSTTAATWVWRLAFCAWVPVVVVPGSYLMAGHLLTLPSPMGGARLATALRGRRRYGDAGRVQALHVLSADCGCSRRVLDHLLERRALPGMAERILLVLDEEDLPEATLAERVRAAGFAFEVLAPEALGAEVGVESAPLLVVADPAGEARYVGGYSDRQRGPEIKDAEILARVARGERPPPLPVFGCATSKTLKRTLDPLRLK